MCVRGLKQIFFHQQNFAVKVARRVRAWIETFNQSKGNNGKQVARRVRAWIET